MTKCPDGARQGHSAHEGTCVPGCSSCTQRDGLTHCGAGPSRAERQTLCSGNNVSISLTQTRSKREKKNMPELVVPVLWVL